MLKTAMATWGEEIRGKLALAHMDDSTAVAFAKYSAGSVPHLAQLPRGVKELEVSLC